MASAEIITIGTELLLGEIQDTNTRYLARLLRDHGIDIYRTTTVGDNPVRVSQVIRESMGRADIVITTGGLGPTVDDPTREAVALAMGVKTVFIPELWDQIVNRFYRFNRTPTENNKRQAYVPEGAVPVENPVGTAPAFYYETEKSVVFCLPGVPREMEYLSVNAVIPYLKSKFDLHGIIKARVLHTIGIGESQVDDLIGDLETYSNPTVGLLAHPGQVDVRITVKADNISQADLMIADMEKIIRERLGDGIYGVDDQTIENVVANEINHRKWKLNIYTYGIEEQYAKQLFSVTGNNGKLLVEDKPVSESMLQNILKATLKDSPTETSIAASMHPGKERQTLYLTWQGNGKYESITRTYGGPPSLGCAWSVNQVMELIRRKLLE